MHPNEFPQKINEVKNEDSYSEISNFFYKSGPKNDYTNISDPSPIQIIETRIKSN